MTHFHKYLTITTFIITVLFSCLPSIQAFGESSQVDPECIQIATCKDCYQNEKCHFCSPGGVGSYGFCVSSQITCDTPAQGMAFAPLAEDAVTCKSTPAPSKCEDCIDENYGWCGFRIVGLPEGAEVPEGDFSGFCIADEVQEVCKAPHPHSLNVIEFSKVCPTAAPPSSSTTTIISNSLVATLISMILFS